MLSIFALRRSLDDGKLQLDSYVQYDAETMMNEEQAEQVAAALEGRTPERSGAIVAADKAIWGMKTRAQFDGAILGVYAFKTSAKMDRQQFWDEYGSQRVAWFKQFRV